MATDIILEVNDREHTAWVKNLYNTWRNSSHFIMTEYLIKVHNLPAKYSINHNTITIPFASQEDAVAFILQFS